jgi:hypothetical protein
MMVRSHKSFFCMDNTRSDESENADTGSSENVLLLLAES